MFFKKAFAMNSVFSSDKPIYIGADHAGFGHKSKTVEWLKAQGYKVEDLGAHSEASVDYPDFAHPVSQAVEDGKAAFGILFCGSANGVAITANKHQGVRAGLCWDNEVAKLVRLHNNANVICLPARFVAWEYARQMIETFMQTAFEGGRHANRVGKMSCG